MIHYIKLYHWYRHTVFTGVLHSMTKNVAYLQHVLERDVGPVWTVLWGVDLFGANKDGSHLALAKRYVELLPADDLLKFVYESTGGVKVQVSWLKLCG